MSYEKLTSFSPEAQSESPVADHVTALASLFPSVVREGKIDFDALRQLLGEDVAKDDELFGLQWKGKAQARRAATTPSLGTLRPCKEESVDWDTTKNLYLEGDNLEVLKLLRKSYAGKVKMIYIDPPYNTGKEFVYPDNYQNGIEEYKKLTGQQGGFKVNAETSGRYHTDWLNMMYPRLILARDLLSDDGVIFINIDDNEVYNLRQLCNDVFGENNFTGVILWKKKTNGNNVGVIPPVHDYVLVYAKSKNNICDIGYPVEQSGYTNPDNDARGPWKTMDLSANHKGPYFSVVNPTTKMEYYPPQGRYWVFNKDEIEKRINDGRIIFGKSGISSPVQKVFLCDRINSKKLVESWWDNHGMNEDATAEAKDLFGVSKIFSHPKPTKFIKNLISIVVNEDDIILDFFSGSATTAHSILKLNAEDGKKRKFICIQLPEVCPAESEAVVAGFQTVCEIAKERIRRAGKKIKDEAGLQGQHLDIGFRVYKLDSSNLRVWNPEIDDLELVLVSHEKHLLPGRSQEDLLYEILLKQGIELTEDARIRELGGKRVYSLGHGQYYACMETAISSDQIEPLALGIAQWKHEESPDNTQCAVFVIDEAFRLDADKLNFAKILEQHGIPSVKAL